MICYFSGTGNSRYVAERIARHTGDDVISLNDRMKSNATDEIVSRAHPLVFVCPTYAWRLPRVVEAHIRETPFRGSAEAYFVLTCGGETSNAIDYVRVLCQAKGWNLRGFAEVLLPDNYIVMFPGVEQMEAARLIEAAEPVITGIAEDIRQGKQFSAYQSNGILGKLESALVNGMFYRLMVHAKGFHTSEICTGCGKCVRLCPLNNIALRDGRPTWGDRCTHCMACIQRCPAAAIEYKSRTQGKARYALTK